MPTKICYLSARFSAFLRAEFDIYVTIRSMDGLAGSQLQGIGLLGPRPTRVGPRHRVRWLRRQGHRGGKAPPRLTLPLPTVGGLVSLI
jgi:hypothetical protein